MPEPDKEVADPAPLASPLLERRPSEEEWAAAARAPLGTLGITRVRKRADVLAGKGIETVADLMRKSPEELKRIPRFGKGTILLMRQMIDEWLTKGETREADIADAPINAETQLLIIDPTEAEWLSGVPAENVTDSHRARRFLRVHGISTATEVAALIPGRVKEERGVGARSVLDLKLGLVRLLDDRAAIEALPFPETREAVESCVETHILNRIPQREAGVLRRRYGLWDGVQETLEETGGRLGRTRECARQIQKKAGRLLRNKFLAGQLAMRLLPRWGSDAKAAAVLKHAGLVTLEDIKACLPGEGTGAGLAFELLSDIYAPEAQDALTAGLTSHPDGIYGEDATILGAYAEACSRIQQILIARGTPEEIKTITESLPSGKELGEAFVQRCCELSPLFGADSLGRVGLRTWKHLKCRTLPDMTYLALLELGRPAHVSEIAAKMNCMFPRRGPFSLQAVNSCTAMNPGFARTGRRGVYGLKDWGLVTPPTLRDFLAMELDARGPTSKTKLVGLGVKKHGYRPDSLAGILSTDNTWFQKIPGGVYALRH